MLASACLCDATSLRGAAIGNRSDGEAPGFPPSLLNLNLRVLRGGSRKTFDRSAAIWKLSARFGTRKHNAGTDVHISALIVAKPYISDRCDRQPKKMRLHLPSAQKEDPASKLMLGFMYFT